MPDGRQGEGGSLTTGYWDTRPPVGRCEERSGIYFTRCTFITSGHRMRYHAIK